LAGRNGHRWIAGRRKKDKLVRKLSTSFPQSRTKPEKWKERVVKVAGDGEEVLVSKLGTGRE